jgi:hypothetical protein
LGLLRSTPLCRAWFAGQQPRGGWRGALNSKFGRSRLAYALGWGALFCRRWATKIRF